MPLVFGKPIECFEHLRVGMVVGLQTFQGRHRAFQTNQQTFETPILFGIIDSFIEYDNNNFNIIYAATEQSAANVSTLCRLGSVIITEFDFLRLGTKHIREVLNLKKDVVCSASLSWFQEIFKNFTKYLTSPSPGIRQFAINVYKKRISL